MNTGLKKYEEKALLQLLLLNGSFGETWRQNIGNFASKALREKCPDTESSLARI